MKELEKDWSPKEKTNCKRGMARQIATELEMGLERQPWGRAGGSLPAE